MLKQLAIFLLSATLVGAGPPPAGKPRIRALVVGVAGYKQQGVTPLIGAYNDATLIADTLLREGAAPADVTLLVDKPEVAENGPRLRTVAASIDGIGTRANILGALKKLVDSTQSGDEVLIAFSGHGLRQAEAVAGNEPDGLDEVFLSYDFERAADGQRMPKAILDDEIGAAIDAIRAKGGNITYVGDFCHSGDSNRGTSGKPSDMPSAQALGLRVERKFASVRDGKFVRDLAVDTSAGRSGWGAYVGLVAAPSDTQAKQVLAPSFADRPDQLTHGVLTVYMMVNLANPRVVSYRDLASRVKSNIDQHTGMPRPLFDGDLDRPIMGGLLRTGATGGSESWTVNKPEIATTSTTQPAKLERLEMSVGKLQGLTEGTIVGLALSGPTGDTTILYGKVSEAEAYRATLLPTSFGDIPAERWGDVRDLKGKPFTIPGKLIATIEQQPVALDYRIALPAAPAQPSPAQAAALQALGKLDPTVIGATFVAAGTAADLVLNFAGDTLALADSSDTPSTRFGTFDIGGVIAGTSSDPRLAVEFALRPVLLRAARFHRLRRVLGGVDAAGGGEDDPARQVTTQFYVSRPTKVSATGDCPAVAVAEYAIAKDATPIGDAETAASFDFQRCDLLYVKITNTGDSELYINPIIFSPDGGILIMDAKAINPGRFAPKESGVLQYSLSDAQADGLLRDDMVLLVTRATDGAAVSFAKLGQCPVVPGPEDGPECQMARGATLGSTRLRGSGGGGSAIEDLIDSALIGSAKRSGTTTRRTDTSALRFSWNTAVSATQ